jgi:hypothetical protein
LKARESGGLARRRKLHQHNFFLLLLASWLQYQVQVDDLMRKKKTENYDTFGFCVQNLSFVEVFCSWVFLFGILGSVFKTLVFYFGFLGINK